MSQSDAKHAVLLPLGTTEHLRVMAGEYKNAFPVYVLPACADAIGCWNQFKV